MIPIFNITRVHKTIEKELQESFQKTLDGSIFILGKNVETFEKEFSSYIGCKYGIGVGSGTEALSLAMQALNIKPGDEVILPANAYPTVFSITSIGAVPRPVDIDSQTFNIDPAKLKKTIEQYNHGTIKLKAVIVVHMYGRPADILAIKKITDHYRIPLIEDCAHAHGSSIQYTVYRIPYTQKLGTFGTVSCFSFYPTKNLGALGDGGMVLTNDPKIAEKVKLLRMYGENKRYNSVLLGRNSRLDEVQAGFLSVKLKYLDKWNEERREIALHYNNLLDALKLEVRSEITEVRDLEGLKSRNQIIKKSSSHFSHPISKNLQLPIETQKSKHVYHLYVIRTPSRNKLKSYLEKHGIGTGIHYPAPVHLIPSMKFLGYKKGDFPESEKASQEVLSLPLWPGIKKEEVEEVAGKVHEFFKNVTIPQ